MADQKKRVNLIFLAAVMVALLVTGLTAGFVARKRLLPDPAIKREFNGQTAFQDVEYQVNLGPRVVGTQAHDQEVKWLLAELKKAGWQASIQDTTLMEHPVQNVVATWGQGKPWIVLGAHYDSRLYADQDPKAANRKLPVPGANDGASGVAVLLELSRVLPAYLAQPAAGATAKASQVTLVFFDAEDNGDIPGWDWLLGSEAYVAGLQTHPDAAVVLDMIGDQQLQIYREKNSTPSLVDQIWAQAARLGYGDQFIPQEKFNMLDDHTPFLKAGIPAVDLIDFDYPYWHTTADTSDKVSARSLQTVGDVVLAWLTQ